MDRSSVSGAEALTRRTRRLIAAFAFAIVAPMPAIAESVYKCIDAQGAIAYQATPCPAASTQREIAIEPAPPPGKAPDYGLASSGKAQNSPARTRSTRTSGRARERSNSPTPEAESWECRASNDETFYQHGPCPTAIAGEAMSGRPKKTRAGASAVGVTPVAGRLIARKDACKRIHAASASDRKGHARDEDVSTYERNLGHDPCR